MNRLDTAYSQRLLPQSPLTKDNLIRGKDKLKEQVEIPYLCRHKSAFRNLCVQTNYKWLFTSSNTCNLYPMSTLWKSPIEICSAREDGPNKAENC